MIALSSGDNTVQLRSRAGELLKTFTGHNAIVTEVFDPFATQLAHVILHIHMILFPVVFVY
jgi:hypothetical protein